MGRCVYCDDKAGWFSDAHESCIKAAQEATASIEDLVSRAAVEGRTYATIHADIETKATEAHLSPDEIHSAVVRGWGKGASELDSRGSITLDRYDLLASIFRDAGITPQEMLLIPGFRVSARNMCFWALTNGTPVMPLERSPFVLMDDELPLLLYKRKGYCREANARQGMYLAVNIPVGCGLSYSVGGYRSYALQQSNVELVDEGSLLFTTKNIYFGGARTSLRIPYWNVISFQPYKVRGLESLGFFRDSATPTLELLVIDDRGFDEHQFLVRVCNFLATPEARAMYSNDLILRKARLLALGAAEVNLPS